MTNEVTTLTSRLYLSIMSLSGLAVLMVWFTIACVLILVTGALLHFTEETCHWGMPTFSESLIASLNLFRHADESTDMFWDKSLVCESILFWNVIIRLFFNTVCAVLVFRRLSTSRRRFATLKSSDAILIDYDQDGNLFIAASTIESRRSELVRVTCQLYLVGSNGSPIALRTTCDGSLKTGMTVKHVIDWDSPLCPSELKMPLTCSVCGHSFSSSSDLITHARSLANSAHSKSYVASLQAARVRIAALHRFVTGARLRLYLVVNGLDQDSGGHTQLLKTFKIPNDFHYRAKAKRYISRIDQLVQIDYSAFGKLA